MRQHISRFIVFSIFISVFAVSAAWGQEQPDTETEDYVFGLIGSARWVWATVLGTGAPIVTLLLWWALKSQDKQNVKDTKKYQDQARTLSRLDNAGGGGRKTETGVDRKEGSAATNREVASQKQMFAGNRVGSRT